MFRSTIPMSVAGIVESNNRVVIYVENQVTLKAIGSHRTSSNLADRCKRVLRNMMDKYEVTLWY